ncbi:peptidase M23B [Magnetococcus marinus MC-1]|uniref:Peptidase M23B n=1 Tax=Magnetococcus marinus (strain ATCC BAA-1437 / JCM 17883 / MC-1) TaxID=156889 RepID=A0L6H6_MAGMM|nr:M23 family metallopeptidase [Magnetococcus marinus]ABK43569.1 peptidase M23B [Magnetococcus marinus MC-1]
MHGRLFILLMLLLPSPLWAASLELSDTLIPGSAVLLTVRDFPPNSTFKGRLGQEPFPIRPNGMALVALDMAQQPGTLPLEVTITPPYGPQQRLQQTIQVGPRSYKTERIDGLPQKKVDLDPKDLARASQETNAIKATYTRRGAIPGYLGGFSMPTKGRFSGVFGSRRILNGQPRRPHNGVDIAAPTGTPLRAIAPAEVVLTGHNYFFTGNTVVLHHGDGMTSLYAHMDSIQVKEGDMVARGQQIGTIGMTGRVTGPHVHWGTMVRGQRVDPLLLPGIRSTPN